MLTKRNRDRPNPVRPGICFAIDCLLLFTIFLQDIVTLAMSRDVFVECAQHKPGLQSLRRLSLLRINQFCSDAEYETTTLLRRPCR